MPENRELKSAYPRELIARRVRELGARITADYRGRELLCVCVLKGAVYFFADLTRAIDNPALSVDFIRASSYGAGTSTSREVRILKDLDEDARGRNLLFIEDIIDSGLTMAAVARLYRERGAASVRLCCLFDQRARREADVAIDYAGFVINSGFLVGYGLDLAERYRTLPDVYELCRPPGA